MKICRCGFQMLSGKTHKLDCGDLVKLQID